jgi:hypothetical protein
MAIFDQIIGSLTGESSLRRIRDRSIQAGRSAYDPTVLNPQIGVAQQQAVQGIDEGAYRRDVINQLFRPVSSAVYGGNQAAAIAGASAQDMARTRALGTFESQLAQQDIQAKQAGAEQLGKLQSSQLQLQGQRDSYTQQVNAEFEAEKDSRRRQLGTALVGFGIQAAGGAGAIGGAIGNKFQSIFGKIGPSPQDIVQSGANMAAERSLQMADELAGAERFDFGSLDFGENLRVGVQGQGTVRLRDVVDRGMSRQPLPFDMSRLTQEVNTPFPPGEGRDAFGNVTDGFPTDWDDASPTTNRAPGQLPAGLSLQEWQAANRQQALEKLEQDRVNRNETRKTGLIWLMDAARRVNPLMNNSFLSPYERYRTGQ